jgi:hypothetical protein
MRSRIRIPIEVKSWIQIWIRIRIYVKSRIRIRIKVMRIRNPACVSVGICYGTQVLRQTCAKCCVYMLCVFVYSNGGYGLQILTRRLRFRLERGPGETGLIDR